MNDSHTPKRVKVKYRHKLWTASITCSCGRRSIGFYDDPLPALSLASGVHDEHGSEFQRELVAEA